MTRRTSKAAPAAVTELRVAGAVANETEDSCSRCHWWTRFTAEGAIYGKCHRFPPTPLAGAGCHQPTTKADDWCGEYAESVAELARPVGFMPQKVEDAA